MPKPAPVPTPPPELKPLVHHLMQCELSTRIAYLEDIPGGVATNLRQKIYVWASKVRRYFVLPDGEEDQTRIGDYLAKKLHPDFSYSLFNRMSLKIIPYRCRANEPARLELRIPPVFMPKTATEDGVGKYVDMTNLPAVAAQREPRAYPEANPNLFRGKEHDLMVRVIEQAVNNPSKYELPKELKDSAEEVDDPNDLDCYGDPREPGMIDEDWEIIKKIRQEEFDIAAGGAIQPIQNAPPPIDEKAYQDMMAANELEALRAEERFQSGGE